MPPPFSTLNSVKTFPSPLLQGGGLLFLRSDCCGKMALNSPRRQTDSQGENVERTLMACLWTNAQRCLCLFFFVFVVVVFRSTGTTMPSQLKSTWRIHARDWNWCYGAVTSVLTSFSCFMLIGLVLFFMFMFGCRFCFVSSFNLFTFSLEEQQCIVKVS